ncbi:bacterial proteasome activator family protein [Nocardioides sp. zg-DK7169]|uniref:bacterial proteasome activator family protein n=1 Tax=Nocardioides sp. zg-DK7169 TaxID=2736600 RepID=UPI0020A626A4|nr:bacterial proteasome activator family protein [Nocardioides sp. zg-DK7169]NPC98132.1 bacterial proteasome activator family protein [Nocardioides sp. zg-DK7169]
MSEQPKPGEQDQQIVVIGPDGRPMAVPTSAVASGPGGHDGTHAQGEDQGHDDQAGGERALTELVEQPAKVMRIGSMIRQLLEEVKSAPVDEASRNRLKEIHRSSIAELEQGLAPELVEELERLTLPFSEDATPSESELRIAQAQLVGWLEGLFHGIQTAIYAQQMAARAQFEQIRRALPAGMVVQPGGVPGQAGQAAQAGQAGAAAADADPRSGGMGGMYL